MGLIPARAGKTLNAFPLVLTLRAHPRACGENDSKRSVNSSLFGSSPRVRGKRYALVLSPPTAVAHPRACGENQITRGATQLVEGSSPRVRGKRCGRGRVDGQGGLIPARAGKTRTGRGVPTS